MSCVGFIDAVWSLDLEKRLVLFFRFCSLELEPRSLTVGAIAGANLKGMKKSERYSTVLTTENGALRLFLHLV